jgi:hypothetical protein
MAPGFEPLHFFNGSESTAPCSFDVAHGFLTLPFLNGSRITAALIPLFHWPTALEAPTRGAMAPKHMMLSFSRHGEVWVRRSGVGSPFPGWLQAVAHPCDTRYLRGIKLMAAQFPGPLLLLCTRELLGVTKR